MEETQGYDVESGDLGVVEPTTDKTPEQPTGEYGANPTDNRTGQELVAKMDREYKTSTNALLKAGWIPKNNDTFWNEFTTPGTQKTVALLGKPISEGVTEHVWSPSNPNAPTTFTIDGDVQIPPGVMARRVVYECLTEAENGSMWKQVG